MTKDSAFIKSSRLRVFLTAAALLVGFLIILATLDVYKYLTSKENYSAKLLRQIANSEFHHVEAFFKKVSNQLFIIRDLGKNGVLSKKDIVGLNRKFMPLLKNQAIFSGVILADTTGWEYFLFKNGGLWTTRVSRPVGSKCKMEFTQWQAPDKPLKKWVKVTAYKPQRRPWFSLEDGKIKWSAVYDFFQSGKPGITASISWKSEKSGGVITVFAVDIPVSRIKRILDTGQDKAPGLPFLLESSSGKIIAGQPRGLGSVQVNVDKLVLQLVSKWKGQGARANGPVSIEYDSNKWSAIFLPIKIAGEGTTPCFWFGMAVPEGLILADLKGQLLKPDVKDILVAVVGGLLLVGLFWKFGGLGRMGQRKVDPLMRLHGYIREGEGNNVEFKSTVRTNLRTGKPGKEIEFAWLKAVVAFLNSEGGALLLGVDDKGKILGLAPDSFENPDKCLLHIKNLINHHIGAEFSNFITVTLVEVDGRDVVMVECSPSKRPVFLKIGKNEEFYIRTGPSSIKLSPSQMISYLLHSGRLKE
ncbi:MAG: ATP-binding protein [Thermodesulfobacteria bacterium]|nr:ATP-binding protein [Thermodesulfobacteriota bacterium]